MERSTDWYSHAGSRMGDSILRYSDIDRSKNRGKSGVSKYPLQYPRIDGSMAFHKTKSMQTKIIVSE